jgi:hypothetical protein
VIDHGWELLVWKAKDTSIIAARSLGGRTAKPGHGCQAGHGWIPFGASLSVIRWLTTVRALF